jgi:CheY-like chemotaxis protein
MQYSILIAEDDADDRYLIKTAFEEKGFNDRIDFVENGVEVLDYLKAAVHTKEKRLPHFILLDLNMPKKDGRQVLKEVKLNADYKKIPVVVFTTARDEAEIVNCYNLGANTYVVKPSSFDQLLKTIEKIRTYWLQLASVPV